jgi:hypothetical protein
VLTVCLRCGKLNCLIVDGSVHCPKCKFTLALKRYDKLIADGSEIILHGVKYRLEYEAQIAKHGRIVRKYMLGTPTIVEAAVAIIVSGVLGNAAYDVVKSTLKSIYADLAKRRLKRQSSPSDLKIFSQDADLIYRLIGNDDNFASTFIGYAKEYVDNRKSQTLAVAQACAEEYGFDSYEDICKNDPSTYVFVSQTGRCFHRKNCRTLYPPTRRIRIKTAILTPLSPCRKCKPI